MTDPIRQNLPSASRWSILENCPGSQNLVNTLPELDNVIEMPDEMAERGRRIHKAWETGNTSKLAEDELEDLTKTVMLADQAASQWQDWLLSAPGMTEKKEQRLWYCDPDTLEPMLSGQYDRLFLCDDYALCLDLKSGFNRRLTSSERNSQLRLLAFLIQKEYGVKNIRVAFVLPKQNKIDATDYNEANLQRVEQQVLHTLWASRQPDAPRFGGEHCFYCPAKPFCREAAAYSLVPAVIGENPVEMVQHLSHEDLKTIWQKSGVIKKVLESVNTRIKSLSDEERKDMGLYIKEGRKLDPITDIVGAFNAVEKAVHALKPELGGEQVRTALWNSLTFGKDRLVNCVKILTGESKSKTEEWLFREVLDHCIERKRGEGQIDEV